VLVVVRAAVEKLHEFIVRLAGVILRKAEGFFFAEIFGLG
jgi:hypothetical protein